MGKKNTDMDLLSLKLFAYFVIYACFLSSADFFIIIFFDKFLQEYH